MPVHVIHIGKTGGTALKTALVQAKGIKTPYGPIWRHKHWYTLDEVPEGHFAIVSVRDPIARFTSSFYSRLRKGLPRYEFEWTPPEKKAFETFPTPQELAEALGSWSRKRRAAAEKAMRGIRHVKSHYDYWLGSAAEFQKRLPSIAYIARQETLAQDWENIKGIFELPGEIELPSDPERAHRGDPTEDRTLDRKAVRTLKRWYRVDYELLDICEAERKRKGWAEETWEERHAG
ncbi:MAG TPA: sulfotransferase family 2 domain-containing protein [Actinomycetota bacterium]